MKKLIILVSLIFLNSWANETGDKNVELKPWSAVSQYNELDGFKITARAEKNLGVTFLKLEKEKSWEIPKSALLTIKHSNAVFRKWNGWITMVLVKVGEKKGKTVKIKSVDLQAGDEIAITGVPFLRMTEADLNSDTVDACAH